MQHIDRHSRKVTVLDAQAAVRGLGMGSMGKAELESLVREHQQSDKFASTVIVQAALMLLNVRAMRHCTA